VRRRFCAGLCYRARGRSGCGCMYDACETCSPCASRGRKPNPRETAAALLSVAGAAAGATTTAASVRPSKLRPDSRVQVTGNHAARSCDLHEPANGAVGCGRVVSDGACRPRVTLTIYSARLTPTPLNPFVCRVCAATRPPLPHAPPPSPMRRRPPTRGRTGRLRLLPKVRTLYHLGGRTLWL
jgi:hypothetical protein